MCLCHEKRALEERLPKVEKKKDKGKGVFNACVAKSDNDDLDFALVGLPSISYFDERILDSGCSYHMCCHRKWFSSFEELDSGVVHMGKNSSCEIIEIGRASCRERVCT